jgi:Peptidase family C25
MQQQNTNPEASAGVPAAIHVEQLTLGPKITGIGGIVNGPPFHSPPLQGPFPFTIKPTQLLVLAPNAFMSAVAPLVTHKNATGITAAAVSIEAIAAYYQGGDEPEKIKQGIRFAKESMGTIYVLLVGDAANFPVRFWFCRGPQLWYPAPNDAVPIPCDPLGAFIQSDLYYASLYHHSGTYPHLVNGAFDTWDANGNGLYNEAWLGNNIADPANTTGGLNTACNPDNVDGYPDIAVGRIPAANASDVAKYVAKVIAYETRGTPPALSCTFVADQAYGDYGATTSMAAILSEKEATVDLVMIENDGNAPVAPFANIDVNSLGTKAGNSFWLSYLGHGAPTAWGSGLQFSNNQVALTENGKGLPIVFAAGCGTALFMPNVPWSGFSGNVTSTDIDGVTRGPFGVSPDAQPHPSSKCLVVEDSATLKTWGINYPDAAPLPVTTPLPAPINISIPCCANQWLFDAAPGGSIVYIGDHCVSNDSYPSEIQTNLLNAYVGAGQPILGSLYLTALQEYWAGPHSKDATTPGLLDYHGIPRLYLGWMVYFGDPSLRLAPVSTLAAPGLCNQTVTGLRQMIGSGINGPMFTVAAWQREEAQLRQCVAEGYLTEAESQELIQEYLAYVARKQSGTPPKPAP